MKKIELAYAAGLFDGEGTITFMRRSAESNKTVIISMTNTDRGLLEFLAEHFGGCIRTQKTYQAHHKPAFVWSISHRRAYNACVLLFPYIKERSKKHRMSIILKYYLKSTPRNGKYSKQQLGLRAQMEDEFFTPFDYFS